MGVDARRSSLAVAFAGVVAGVVVIAGCGGKVEGTAKANDKQAAAYVAEVSASSSAAASSKKAAEVSAACTMFGLGSMSAIGKYNAFIEALNAGASDTKQKREDAAKTLTETADRAAESVSDLPPELSGLFTDYADTYRKLANLLRTDGSDSELNTVADQSDVIKDSIKSACPTL